MTHPHEGGPSESPAGRCVYELYFSLLLGDTDFTYDMYTILDWQAVGITSGLAAVDMNSVKKGEREKRFPSALCDIGISFKCEHGEASMPEDRERIIFEIGTDKELLDGTVHSVVAASVLEQVLKKGVVEECERYLEALGKARRLRVDLSNSQADTEANGIAIVEALGENCEVLELKMQKVTMLSTGLSPQSPIMQLNPTTLTLQHLSQLRCSSG